MLPTLSGASLRALEATSTNQQQAFATKVPKGMVQPAGGKGEVFGSKMIKPSMVSSNILAEPYRGEKVPLPLSSWVTPSGWSLVCAKGPSGNVVPHAPTLTEILRSFFSDGVDGKILGRACTACQS